MPVCFWETRQKELQVGGQWVCNTLGPYQKESSFFPIFTPSLNFFCVVSSFKEKQLESYLVVQWSLLPVTDKLQDVQWVLEGPDITTPYV